MADTPKKDVAPIPAPAHHRTMAERTVHLYDREAAKRREAHYPPFFPSEEITNQIDSLVTDGVKLHYDSTADETFVECLICGEWESHADSCPWPALDKWMRMEVE